MPITSDRLAREKEANLLIHTIAHHTGEKVTQCVLADCLKLHFNKRQYIVEQ
jgi:hypothetical protein